MSPRLAAVVLAAGRGSRLGGRKLELPWGDGTILSTVLRTATAAADPVVVVLGHEPDRLQPVVAAAGARWVLNSRFDEGMVTSVQAGLRALPPVAGAFIVPGDQPLLTPVVYAALRAAWTPDAAWLVPVHAGRRGHPLLLGATLFPAALALPPTSSLRDLRAAHAAAVVRVPVTDPGVLLDLDTPADYRALHPPEPGATEKQE